MLINLRERPTTLAMLPTYFDLFWLRGPYAPYGPGPGPLRALWAGYKAHRHLMGPMGRAHMAHMGQSPYG